jgi:hypothetical protein
MYNKQLQLICLLDILPEEIWILILHFIGGYCKYEYDVFDDYSLFYAVKTLKILYYFTCMQRIIIQYLIKMESENNYVILPLVYFNQTDLLRDFLTYNYHNSIYRNYSIDLLTVAINRHSIDALQILMKYRPDFIFGNKDNIFEIVSRYSIENTRINEMLYEKLLQYCIDEGDASVYTLFECLLDISEINALHFAQRVFISFDKHNIAIDIYYEDECSCEDYLSLAIQKKRKQVVKYLVETHCFNVTRFHIEKANESGCTDIIYILLNAINK